MNREYLINLFKYNDWANKLLLESIKKIPNNDDACVLFSHLIHAQNKWLNRIQLKHNDSDLLWFGHAYPLEELHEKWEISVEAWLSYLENECQLDESVKFKRASDNQLMEVKIIDMILQLNYHSIHHRAQINTIIRKQGCIPPATDYILTVLKEA